MTEDTSPEKDKAGTPRRGSRAILVAAALIAATAAGAGATALVQKGRAVTLVALTPQPIAMLKNGASAALKGDIAEIFGNKFVVQDASGRVLVETGRRGEGTALVAKGEAITVQGRFDHGFLRAAAITHADGRVEALDPPPPPPPSNGPGLREMVRPPA